jgi:hypothetical protein
MRSEMNCELKLKATIKMSLQNLLPRLLFKALLISFFSVEALAAKAVTVKNFVPGNYKLSEGQESLCGDGKFYISDDGKRVWFGPYYQFMTKDDVLTSQSDLVIEKGCQETTKYSVSVKGKTTKLTSVDTISCKGKVRRTTTEEATVTKSKISMIQSVDVAPEDAHTAPGNPHSCVWTKK